MAARVCMEPGCPRLCAPEHSRCTQHQAEHARAKSRRRGFSAHAAGYDALWEKTRRRFIAKHPLCSRGDGRPAVEVHHIDGRGPHGPRGHDEANLEGLCKPCHSQETRSRQAAALRRADREGVG